LTWISNREIANAIQTSLVLSSFLALICLGWLVQMPDSPGLRRDIGINPE
jgi:hypothetical protein